MNGFTRLILLLCMPLLASGCGNSSTPEGTGAGGKQKSATSKTEPPAAARDKVTSIGPLVPDGAESIVPAPPTEAQKDKAVKVTPASTTDDVGKQPAKDAKKPDEKQPVANQPNDKSIGAAAKIDLKPVDLAGFEKRIAELKGKTVVVDCWATWCLYCVQKFPKFVNLAKQRQSPSVVFLSLNFDEDDAAAEALDFLTQNRASFENLRMTTKQTTVAKKYNFEALPVYFIFGPDGKVLLKATGNHAMDELEVKLNSPK